MGMYRGTTPTLVFILPFMGSALSKLNIAFEQNGTVVLEKTLTDCTVQEKRVSLTLTQQETLAFSAQSPLQIQLRAIAEGKALASRVIVASVEAILRDGVLS